MATEPNVEEIWRALLTGENPYMHRGWHLYGMPPSNPRCNICNAPFGGIGTQFMRFTSKRRSKKILTSAMSAKSSRKTTKPEPRSS
jgi:hypothetical protein